MEEKSEHLFSNQALKLLLFPLIIEQLLNSLMGTIDTIMVSNVGPGAMSAVSLVDSINMLVLQTFVALAAGGTIVCSQYIGKKMLGEANKSAGQALFIMTAIAVGITLICIAANGPLLSLIFGTIDPEVMAAAKTYFYLTAASYPFIAIYNVGAAVNRAQGNSRRPMKISMISNVINIAGNAIFIWIFHWGVFGVALATLLSRIFSAVVVLWYLRKNDQDVIIRDYLKIRPNLAMIGTILAIGIPSGIENSMFQFGKLAIQSTVSTLGTTAIAAQAMTSILEGLNGVAVSGIGIGLMTVVGQCMGAGRKDEAVYFIKKLTVIGEVTLIANCLIVFVLTKPITILGGMEPESAKMCFEMMIAITIMKPLAWTLSFIPAYGMRAAGDVKFSMLVSTLTMWTCRVTLAICLCRVWGFGPIAVWIGMFVDWSVRGIIFSIRFHSRKWLEHKVI